MILNIEAGANIKYTDETGTYYFHEGDKVICHVGEQVYSGIISWIGRYQEIADSELQQVIYIDTWNGRTSMSREMIKVKDITEIYRNPFSHSNSDKTCSGERGILDALIEKGYSKEQAGALCNRMQDMVEFYFIPYIKATKYAIEAVRQVNASDKNDAKDIIMDLAKQCMEEAQKEYFELIGIYAKEIEQCSRDTNCLTDTLKITSKCWNDLRDMKADRTEKVSKN